VGGVTVLGEPHRGACEGAVTGGDTGGPVGASGGPAPEGVVALAATVLDDARVRALTWEDDRLLLWLLVEGTTGALTRTTVVYDEATMTGMSIAEATRCTVLSQRVEARPDGSGRHRVWLYPEGEIVVDFAEVDVRKG
jgi:hypothetical protein